jgi:hypothetical protein
VNVDVGKPEMDWKGWLDCKFNPGWLVHSSHRWLLHETSAPNNTLC